MSEPDAKRQKVENAADGRALKTEAIEKTKQPQLTRDYGPLIITVALTGNVNTKARNPSLPCSGDEIAEDVRKCAAAGATVFHLHARDENEKPTQRLDIIRANVKKVKALCPDVIVQISTGGRAGTGQERIDPIDLLPEMGSFSTGTVNLNPVVYENSPKLIDDLAKKYQETGVKPQIEVFDHSMITNALEQVKKGVLTPPLDFAFVMGAPGAQDAKLHNLAFLVQSLPPGSTWNTIGVGKHGIPLAACAIAMGGHVRVGLEDTNRMPDGTIATNEKLVQKVVEIAKAMGREVATPDQAREVLGLRKDWKDRILEKC